MAPGGRSRTPSLRAQQVSPMPMIAEDATDPPTLPQRSPRRTRPGSISPITPLTIQSGVNRRCSTGSNTARTSSERPAFANVGGPSPDHLKTEGPRHHDAQRQGNMGRMAKRGSWYKLILISILLVGVIIGLAVGLTLGLRKRNRRSLPPPLPTDIFPAGSYAFTVALTDISTSCLPTTIPINAWNCPPYRLYNSSSPDLSSTTFHWTIEPVTRFSEYVISSSSPDPSHPGQQPREAPLPPTAPQFTNLSLTLLDSNQQTERFEFSFTMSKFVPLTLPLPTTNDSTATTNSSSSSAAAAAEEEQITCFFNSTVLTATIWTRARAAHPANITDVPAPVNASRTSSKPWPFRVEVTEEAPARPQQGAVGAFPDCRDGEWRSIPVPGPGPVAGAGAGAGVVSEVGVGRRSFRGRIRGRQDAGSDDKNSQCSCSYANYGLTDSDVADGKPQNGTNLPRGITERGWIRDGR